MDDGEDDGLKLVVMAAGLSTSSALLLHERRHALLLIHQNMHACQHKNTFSALHRQGTAKTQNIKNFHGKTNHYH